MERHPFLLPKEKALHKATAPHKARASAEGKLPAWVTGVAGERDNLSLNEIVTEAEVAFDSIYLPYPRHTQMQLSIDRIRLHGLRANGAPMRGLGILGPTGSGKTTGITHYIEHLKQRREPTDRSTPLLYIRLRTKTTVTHVLRSMLQKFGDRYAYKRNVYELNDQVRNCIARAGVEVIVLDECQHLKNLSNDSMGVTDQFKVFLDDSIAPVVFVGTYEARPMFAANPELCGRLAEPVDLAPLQPENPDDVALFVEFLRRLDGAMIERDLVRQTSSLGGRFQVAGLFEASGGVIGTAYRIVRAGMGIALRRDANCIEPYDLGLAVDKWAVANGFCRTNPFRRPDVQALL